MKQPSFEAIMEEAESLAAASDDWGGGIDTHGYNNISKMRGDMIAQKKKVYFHCDAELHDLLPAEVADRLKAMIP